MTPDTTAVNVLSGSLLAEAQRLAREQSWREGWAHRWALDEGQQAWRTAFLGTAPLSSTVWNVGRQRGKTFAAVFLALETCLRLRGGVVRYCAKTKDSAVGIVMPAWKVLTETMPEDMRPRQGRSDYEWTFPSTGATFVLFGTDAQSFTKGRGPRTDLQLLDECGFYQDLVSVESALLPSLQTTGGRALYLSTPAESVGHPYTARIYAALAAGRYQHGTFWDNPRVDHEAVIEAERTRLGMSRETFLASTYFRREYLAEIVTDESRAAMPSWSRELAQRVVGEWVRPEYYDGYQAHDPGKTGDPHASLFGYLDPARNALVIEDELELRSAATSVGGWAAEVKRRETLWYGVDSWGGTVAGAEHWLAGRSDVPDWVRDIMRQTSSRQPYLRVGDDAGDCRDLSVDHGLCVFPAEKHDKSLEASNTNQLLFEGRILIHLRCVGLIRQLYATVWNRTRSSWERTDQDHGDLIDCLVYMTRHVRWNRDCRPVKWVDPYVGPPKPVSGWTKLVG